MQWLHTIVDELIARVPEGEILIESGASPSGTYHVGHLREVITSDAILLELRRRGRQARHIHFVDDLDALRKVPVNVPQDYDQHLGKPLCDTPAPDGSDQSYADHFLSDLIAATSYLGIEMEVIRSHEKYRSGFDVPAIEMALTHIQKVKDCIVKGSGRQLSDDWNPIQILEEGRFKNRALVDIDKEKKEVIYRRVEGGEARARYDNGDVKLDWRIDWPTHWWLQGVNVEAFGRDHATKGGSYDTGVEIIKDVFGAEPPYPVPYDFVNRTGDPKKMSASRGTGISAKDIIKVLPAEIIRFFMLRYPPSKRLYFDEVEGTVKLVDEFAELAAKSDKTKQDEDLLYMSTRGSSHQTISPVPFSHLVASYQSALRDTDKTIEIIRRTEHAEHIDEAVITRELVFIDEWLHLWAPEDVKFQIAETLPEVELSEQQKTFLRTLADKIEQAPEDADGEWFHKAIYDLKDSVGLEPKQLFQTLYQVLINKMSGPRAGWFLSLLPREWLVKRLRLES